MAKINILSSNIYNKIAAGEVVQRPASVVKELVENAIDAGADSIDVTVAGGGLESIEIVDNGSGIESEFLATAFLPHATSKIGTEEDLDGIRTLGFRGEALASIAAVSRVTLISKPKAQDCAGKIEISGEKYELAESSGTDGTTIAVRNLFYHTPARLKFMKSAKSEENEISALISRLILANPGIAFRYRADGKEIFSSEGKGLFEAMCAIYGSETLANCLEVSYQKDGYTLGGFVGKGGYSKPNRTYQTVILNGRYVQNQTVGTAATNAYGDFLMKRQYPFFVLRLDVPIGDVDVNVHPAKSEVRFSDNNRVFGIVYKTVFNALRDLNALKAETGFPDEVFMRPETPIRERQICAQTEMRVDEAHADDAERLPEVKSLEVSLEFEPQTRSGDPAVVSERGVSRCGGEEQSSPDISKVVNVPDATREDSESQSQTDADEDDDLEYKIERNEFDMQIYDAGIDVSKLKILGALFQTYIVVEYVEEFFLIDQHAAHERLIFDRFRNQEVNNSVQSLLIPYILTLNPQEDEIFVGILDDLKRLNFEIEPFGAGSYKINGIPLVLTGFDIDGFFREVAGDVKNIQKLSDFAAVRDRLAQKACKAAVKAGDALEMSEIRALLSYMKKSTLRCPHGRPVIIKFSKTEVEKWFKRIV